MQPVQNITVDDRVSRTQYQYTLEDPNTDELNEWTNKFVAQLDKLPQLEDVATDQQTGARAISLEIDRVTASRLGIAPATIDNTLYDAFGQREINTLYTQTNQYHVILETQPEWQQNPAKLGDIYIQSNASTGASGAGAVSSFSSSASAAAGTNALTSAVRYTPSSSVMVAPASALPRVSAAGTSSPSSGTVSGTTPNTTTASSSANAVPLGTFTRAYPTTEALSINHQGQFPAVTVSFNLASNASLGTAISDINRVARQLNFPPSLQVSFQGTAASFENSLSNESLLILAALVTVYIVLGVLYESYIHPITILSTLPSAGVGALLALMICREDLSVVAVIGIILLIGIVKKNGIMIVDFALEAERIAVSSTGEVERLADVFNEYNLSFRIGSRTPKPGSEVYVDESSYFAEDAVATTIVKAYVPERIALPEANLVLFGARDLFDEPEVSLAHPQRQKSKVSAFLSDFRDLAIGDYVVHVEHGIGQYQGLKEIPQEDGGTVEFMVLQYAEGARLYVPLTRLDLVQKYRSSEGVTRGERPCLPLHEN